MLGLTNQMSLTILRPRHILNMMYEAIQHHKQVSELQYQGRVPISLLLQHYRVVQSFYLQNDACIINKTDIQCILLTLFDWIIFSSSCTSDILPSRLDPTTQSSKFNTYRWVRTLLSIQNNLQCINIIPGAIQDQWTLLLLT